MKKANKFRSSNFYMATGDKLTIRIKSETGVTPVFTLQTENPDGTNNEQEVPGAAVALPATDITSSGFTANWEFTENSNAYYLDVATDSAFTSMVAGYDNLSVGGVKEYDVVGLDDAIPYFYRIRAVNDYGTGTDSNTITVTTALENVVDADGNVYTYVTIGTQQWMVENFRSTKYADGTAIPNLTLDADWAAEDGTVGHDGAYCYYNNDIANKADYGALYNWYAIDNAHGLAPAGWRAPSEADMDALVASVGGEVVAGGKLKEIGLAHWLPPNTDATDEYGFNGLPGGVRYPDGSINYINVSGLWWCSSKQRELFYLDASMMKSGEANKSHGVSVRLMRDI